jgi:hypothetical protein
MVDFFTSEHMQRLVRTPDTVWQLLSQLADFISLKNRRCALWGTMPPWSLQED